NIEIASTTRNRLLGAVLAISLAREEAAGQPKRHESHLAAESRRSPRAIRGLSVSKCSRSRALCRQSLESPPAHRLLLSVSPQTTTQAAPHDPPCPGGDDS